MFSTKYRRPVLTNKYVPRAALIGKLNSFLGLPLVLVSAPAGYGKTTTVNAWAEQMDEPVLWISLDENTNLKTFFLYLTGAAVTAFPGTFRRTSELSSGPFLTSFNNAVEHLADDIDDLGRELLLVVDNYESVRDSQIHELVAVMVKNMSPPLHTILVTRHEPPLPIAGLRARNQLGEILAKDLQFSQEEECALFEMTECGDSAEIISAASEMEGWAVGLTLLAASLVPSGDDGQVACSSEHGWRNISDYVKAEVLSGIMPSFRDLLFRLAFPQRFSADLCDALFRDSGGVLPPVSGLALLRRLERDNLFITNIEDFPGWYRFHPVFHQVLRSCAGEYFETGEIEEIHSAVAHWLIRYGRGEDALYHAGFLRSALALELFMEARSALLDAGNHQILDRWLNLFPDAMIEFQPGLLLSRAWSMMMNLRLEEIPGVLAKVESLLSIDGNEAENGYRNELAMLRTLYAVRTGDVSAAIDLVRTIDKVRFPPGGYLNIVAGFTRAESSRLSGSVIENTRYFPEMAKFSTIGRQELLHSLSLRCRLETIDARLVDAGKTADLMLVVAREQENFGYQGTAEIYLGISSYQRNELTEAGQHFTAALGLLRYLDTEHVITAYLGLAASEQALRRDASIRNILERTRSYLLSLPNPDLLPFIDNFETELSLRRGVLYTRGAILPPEWHVLFTAVFYHPSLTYCRYLVSDNRHERTREARFVLEKTLLAARSTGNTLLSSMALAYSAQLYETEGDTEKAGEHLEQALLLAERGNCLRIFLDLGLPMARLLLRNGHLHAVICGDILEAFSHGLPAVSNEPPRALWGRLTEQEFRVLEYLRQRFSNKEIADQLSITAATVKSHTIHIYQKLNVGSRREAVEKASRLGMFLS